MSNTGKLPANQRQASVYNNPPSNMTNTPAPLNNNQAPATLANKINSRSRSASSITNSLNQNGQPARGPEPSATESIMDRVNSFIDNSTNYVKSLGNNTNTNTDTKSSSNKPNTTKPSANETATLDVVSAISDNYIIVLGLFFAFVLLVLLYFFSKSFNVSRVVDKMKVYRLYQKINNYDFRDKTKADATLVI
jgi:hypothetical protein